MTALAVTQSRVAAPSPPSKGLWIQGGRRDLGRIGFADECYLYVAQWSGICLLLSPMCLFIITIRPGPFLLGWGGGELGGRLVWQKRLFLRFISNSSNDGKKQSVIRESKCLRNRIIVRPADRCFGHWDSCINTVVTQESTIYLI